LAAHLKSVPLHERGKIRRAAFPRSGQNHVGWNQDLGFGAGLCKGFLYPIRIARRLGPPRTDLYWPVDEAFGGAAARSIGLSRRKFVIGRRKLAARNEDFHIGGGPIELRSRELASGCRYRTAPGCRYVTVLDFGCHFRVPP